MRVKQLVFEYHNWEIYIDKAPIYNQGDFCNVHSKVYFVLSLTSRRR
jgi:hypothetical protein